MLPFGLSTVASNKGNQKFFPIAVRFYSVNENGNTDGLLGFWEQVDETATSIFELLVKTMETFGFDIKFSTAYSVDNAPINFGKNSSVGYLLN